MTDVAGFARAIVLATTLEGKLAPPPRGLRDDGGDGDAPERIAAERIAAPGRPPELVIASHRKVRVPPIAGMRDPDQRTRILHALANHELQAIELFAWALLAFPDAPAAFRRGLLGILADEQRHCGLYLERLAAHGVRFGDHPVTGHFWNKLDDYATPLAFVCAMGLTFENANLDFAGEYAAAAREAGDVATADVLAVVHADEVRHVAFAWRWLRALAPDAEPWATYLASVRFPLGPARARGRSFDRTAREAAGIDADFIDHLEASAPRRPGGEPR